MRVVVDSNMLESDELREFLSASPGNRAILADYAWIEAYKQDAANSILSRLSVLKDFPQQVDVLKSTRAIAALTVGPAHVADRMIRRNSRSEFARTVKALTQIETGAPGVVEQVLRHAQRAGRQSSRMSLGVPEILTSMPEMQDQMFTAAEVRICRTSNSYTPQMIGSIFGAAEQIGEMLLECHPGKLPALANKAPLDIFYHRCALAIVLHVVAWIRVGSPKRTRHDKVHNDMIDLMFATLGTYFNGLMSRDAKALDVYWNLRGALIARGAEVPPDWRDLWAIQND